MDAYQLTATLVAALHEAQAASRLSPARGQRKRERQEAEARFVEATSRAISSAEYLAVLGRASRSSQLQVIGTSAMTLLVDTLSKASGADLGGSMRRLTRMTFTYSLAEQLVAQHATRVDVRDVFAVMSQLILASG